MSDEKRRTGVRSEVVVPLFRTRRDNGVGVGSTPPRTVPPRTRPARVAHMLALGIRIERMIAEGELEDRADAAATFRFSRARITQILGLTLLAPDIQEELLFLEVADGVEAITERALRPLVAIDEWEHQRALWHELKLKVASHRDDPK